MGNLLEGLARLNRLNEDTSPDKPLQVVVETSIKAICGAMRSASDRMERLGLEILEVNTGRPVNEQFLNERINISEECKNLGNDLAKAQAYAEKAGTAVKTRLGDTLLFTDFQVKSVCDMNDGYVQASNKSIITFAQSGIWLKPDNNPQYTTEMFREKYMELTETVKKVYVFCIALLNKFYDSKKLPNMTFEAIPATKTVYGKLLIEGASGETDTKPPFITESMFNTGK